MPQFFSGNTPSKGKDGCGGADDVDDDEERMIMLTSTCLYMIVL